MVKRDDTRLHAVAFVAQSAIFKIKSQLLEQARVILAPLSIEGDTWVQQYVAKSLWRDRR